jgi:hypothetical protein
MLPQIIIILCVCVCVCVCINNSSVDCNPRPLEKVGFFVGRTPKFLLDLQFGQ